MRLLLCSLSTVFRTQNNNCKKNKYTQVLKVQTVNNLNIPLMLSYLPKSVLFIHSQSRECNLTNYFFFHLSLGWDKYITSHMD